MNTNRLLTRVEAVFSEVTPRQQMLIVRRDFPWKPKEELEVGMQARACEVRVPPRFRLFPPARFYQLERARG